MFPYERKQLDSKEAVILHTFAGLSDEDFLKLVSGSVNKFASEFHTGLREGMQILRTGLQHKDYPNFTYIPIMHFEVGSLNHHALHEDVRALLKRLPQTTTLFVSGESDLPVYTKNTLTKDKQRFLKNARTFYGATIADGLRHYKMEGWETALLDFVKADPRCSAVGTDVKPVADIMPRILMNSLLVIPPSEAHAMGLLLLEFRTRIALMRIARYIKTEEAVVYFQGFGHAYGVKEWAKRNGVHVNMIVPKSLSSVAHLIPEMD